MKKYQINKHLITEKVQSRLAAFDSQQSILFNFNETATYILDKLLKGWDENKIVHGLTKRYRVKEQQAHTDVRELIKKLKQKGIIT